MEQRDPVPEARDEAAERLRRQRDLRHEHDRAAAPGERRLAGAQVHLGLAAARGPVQQDVAAAGREQLVDAAQRALLRRREVLRRRLRGQPAGRRHVPPLAPPLRVVRRDQPERTRGRRAVVVGQPEREVDERRRHRLADALDRRRLDALGRRDVQLGDDAAAAGVPEPHVHHVNSRASARVGTSGYTDASRATRRAYSGVWSAPWGSSTSRPTGTSS